jgi:hypothetical protein
MTGLKWLSSRSEDSYETEIQFVCTGTHLLYQTARAAAQLDHRSTVTAEASRFRMLHRAPLCSRSVE